MKFNLKLFVLVGVLAGFRDVCGTEADDEDFYVNGLVKGNKDFIDAVKGNRVIKAVYRAGNDGIVRIIGNDFEDKLYKVLVCAGKAVDEKGINDLVADGFDSPCYYMQKDVEYTVYFIFNDELLNSTVEMFFRCVRLIKADFRYFNTQSVTSMDSMFWFCCSLKELNLSNFVTTNVTSMSGMFSDCSVLKELDLSNFNTSKVTDMSYMFYKCSALQNVFLPSKGVDIKKKCICCGDEYVCWNNHEVGGLDPNIVQDKNPE